MWFPDNSKPRMERDRQTERQRQKETVGWVKRIKMKLLSI